MSGLRNRQMVEIERLGTNDGSPLGATNDPTPDELLADPLRYDVWRLRALIERHERLTNSSRAEEILNDFDSYLPRFYKVVPIEFRKALVQSSPAAIGSA